VRQWIGRVAGVFVLVVASGMSSPGLAMEAAVAPRAGEAASAFMRVYGETKPPHGFVRFCAEYDRECVPGRPQNARFEATPERLAELDAVNRQVNRQIEATTDLDVYGQTEYWAIPTTRGDCEDYALLKRQRLIRAGWPVGALLMTVVYDEKGEGHAVLTARMSHGDLVLDNKHDDIKLWSKTGYTYVMRQSYIDPRVWLSLEAKESAEAPLIGGVRAKGPR
jgi:predicted transglutaminase-like cysteine proteinase